MHAQRTAVAVAAGVGMLCTFLPWVKGPIVGSVDGTEGDGWITLALCAVALVFVLTGDKRAPLTSGARTGSALFGVAAGGIALWKIVDFNSAMADNPFGRAFSVGIGLYLLVAAGAAIAILPSVVRGTPLPPAPPPPAPPAPPA